MVFISDGEADSSLSSSAEENDENEEHNKLFEDDDHASNICIKLQAFYKQKQFFDIILMTTDGSQFPAHRFVLSATSGYFTTSFRIALKSGDGSSERMIIQEIEGPTLKSVVDFMYSGSIELCKENIKKLYRAAVFFRMPRLLKACGSFLEEQLDAGNCLDIVLFAEQYNNEVLECESYKYAFENFKEVYTKPEFSQMTEERLSKLLSVYMSFQRSEETLFLSLITWLKHNEADREKYILKLLSKVRYKQLTPKFIIENNRPVCKSIETYGLICNWLEWHLSPESRLEINRLAFIDSYHKVHYFDLESNSWTHEPLPQHKNLSLPKIRAYSVIVIDGKLIVVGGFIHRDVKNSIACLDLETKLWIDMPSMKTARALPALTDLKGDLYVIGGFADENATKWLQSVEKYDFSKEKWEDVGHLLTPMVDIKVTSLDSFLYAIGKNSDFIEFYHLRYNRWFYVAGELGLKEPGIVGHNGFLYAFGGMINGAFTDAIKRLDPEPKSESVTWDLIGTLGLPRSGLNSVVLNGKIILSGGHSAGKGWSELVEEFDPETFECRTLMPLLPEAASICSDFFTINDDFCLSVYQERIFTSHQHSRAFK